MTTGPFFSARHWNLSPLNITFRNKTIPASCCLIVSMMRAHSVRFVPAAVLFLLLCVSVLFLAAASTLMPLSGRELPQLRAEILSTLLR
jgi:hypothetical protein